MRALTGTVELNDLGEFIDIKFTPVDIRFGQKADTTSFMPSINNDAGDRLFDPFGAYRSN